MNHVPREIAHQGSIPGASTICAPVTGHDPHAMEIFHLRPPRRVRLRRTYHRNEFEPVLRERGGVSICADNRGSAEPTSPQPSTFRVWFSHFDNGFFVNLVVGNERDPHPPASKRSHHPRELVA